ncbi:Holliday junction branch migration protein RuvA [Actinomycetaceae bacterium TAE3-ERU4]|nr:Holliday junction branch migration protein RuvA [Actinomycetaceae bacterium TAE3-ERU4]
MIASIRGTVSEIGLTNAVVTVGGFGMLVFAPTNTLASFQIGKEVFLSTSLVVREDSMTIFGFENSDDRAAFETLITLTGVGPKMALAILSLYDAEELRAIAASKNEKALTGVKGIGKKGAQRIILEIGDKLGAPTRLSQSSGIPLPVSGGAEVQEALVQLGWQSQKAEAAVGQVLESHPAASNELILRLALQILGGR